VRPDGEAEDFMVRGECRKHDPELWFSRLQNAAGTKEAKLLCKVLCPVRAECLRYALKYGQDVGIWGGKTALERRNMPAEDIRLILKGEEPIRLPDASKWEWCGTKRGAARHRRREEKVCRSCLAAEARRSNDNKREVRHG
jgi:hypothetical protein